MLFPAAAFNMRGVTSAPLMNTDNGRSRNGGFLHTRVRVPARQSRLAGRQAGPFSAQWPSVNYVCLTPSCPAPYCSSAGERGSPGIVRPRGLAGFGGLLSLKGFEHIPNTFVGDLFEFPVLPLGVVMVLDHSAPSTSASKGPVRDASAP